MQLLQKLTESYQEMKIRLNSGWDPERLVQNNQQYQEAVAKILSMQEKKISLWLAGGALLWVIQYKILKDLFDRGFRPCEYVGNSIWAMLAILFITWNYDQKYFDFMLLWWDKVNMSDNFHIVLWTMTPFLFDFEINWKIIDIKTFIIENYAEYYAKIKQYQTKDLIINWKIDENIIKNIILDIYKTKYPDVELWNTKLKKLTFNDINTRYETNLRILWTAIIPLNIIKRGKKVLSKITFRGWYSVLDAIVCSTKAFRWWAMNIKWRNFFVTDWFMSGNQYPHSDRQYSVDDDSFKVLIQTDTNYIWWHIVFENLWDNDMVISPDITEWRFDVWYPFDPQNIAIFSALWDEFINKT